MLVNEYYHATKHLLTRHGWEYKKWKKNHHAWGKDTHDGCFTRYLEGKRNLRFQSLFREAVARAATILNLPVDEIRYACNKALEDFQYLAIHENEINIGYFNTVSKKTTPDEIRAVLAKHKMNGTMKAGDKLTAPEVVNMSQKGKSQRSKKNRKAERRERLKAWHKEYDVLPGERPKRIKVSGLSEAMLSMLAPEVAIGLPPAMLKEFRAWCAALNEQHAGKTLDEKIDGFLSDDWLDWTKPGRMAFTPWTPETSLLLTFERYGAGKVFKRDQAMDEAYSDYLKAGGIPLSENENHQKIAYVGYREGRSVDGSPGLMKVNIGTRDGLWSFGEVENMQPVILHDAHVLESRKRRAARLRKLREVAQREGQARFHTNVLGNFDGCTITGLTMHLEAAHIIPDSTHDYMQVSNGLALVGFLHKAFDALMFTINPLTLTVYVAPAYRAFLNIHGKQIRDGNIWMIDRSALAHHWERFKEANPLTDAA